MPRIELLSFLLLLLLPHLSTGFGIQPSQVTRARGSRDSSRAKIHPLKMISDEREQNSLKRKRRRKRKVVDESVTAASELNSDDAESYQENLATPSVELKPRNDRPIELQVMDVREAVGGKKVDNSVQANTIQSSSTTTTPSSALSPSSPAALSSPTPDMDDSLQQLLRDAREMQDAEGERTGDEDGNMKAKIRNALGTLVTVDFFIVCGFLLWFLLGIFCSSVLKDDTVQIAFNSNFQAFVQPALGVLMIAAIGGNFFKEEEEEEEMM